MFLLLGALLLLLSFPPEVSSPPVPGGGVQLFTPIWSVGTLDGAGVQLFALIWSAVVPSSGGGVIVGLFLVSVPLQPLLATAV